jgi:hypothetical protein
MNKIVKLATAATFVAASASASAFWGGPFNSFADDFFGNGMGDGNGDFSMNMNANANTHTTARGYGYNRYYGYNAPYYGVPYGYAPMAPVAQVPAAQ